MPQLLPAAVLSTLAADADFGDAFGFLVTGFTVVMLTLVSLAVVCGLVGALFRKFPFLAGQAEAVPARRSGTSGGPADARLMAVIGAAVDQALGGRHRIVSVKPVEKK